MSALDGVEGGDIARVKSLKALFRDGAGKWVADFSYSAPKGSDFIVLVLGIAKHDEDHQAFALKQIGALGFIPDPALAETAAPPQPTDTPSPKTQDSVCLGGKQ